MEVTSIIRISAISELYRPKEPFRIFYYGYILTCGQDTKGCLVSVVLVVQYRASWRDLGSPHFSHDEFTIFPFFASVSCTNGTYLDKDTGECLDCPKGTYQDQEAKEFCYKCPNGTSTSGPRSKNASYCKGVRPPSAPFSCFEYLSQCRILLETLDFERDCAPLCHSLPAYCRPGFHSPDGLEPCLSCEKGTYQHSTGQTTCFKCEENTTTSAEGASSRSNCAGVLVWFMAQPCVWKVAHLLISLLALNTMQPTQILARSQYLVVFAWSHMWVFRLGWY